MAQHQAHEELVVQIPLLVLQHLLVVAVALAVLELTQQTAAVQVEEAVTQLQLLGLEPQGKATLVVLVLAALLITEVVAVALVHLVLLLVRLVALVEPELRG